MESLRATLARTPLAVAVVVADRARLLECADALKASLPRALVGRLGMARLGVLVPEAAGSRGIAPAAQ